MMKCNVTLKWERQPISRKNIGLEETKINTEKISLLSQNTWWSEDGIQRRF